MSVLAMVDARAQPDKVEALKEMLRSILPDTRTFDGCEGVSVHQSEDDPAQLMLLLRWATRSDYERYLGWRNERGELQQLFSLLAGEPAIRYYNRVEA